MTELLALFSSAGLGIAVTCTLLLLIWLLSLLPEENRAYMDPVPGWVRPIWPLVRLVSHFACSNVPPQVMDVLASARQVWRESAGAFDPTVGALSGWHFEPGQHAMPAAADIAAALRHVDARQLRLDERACTAYLTERGVALDLGGIAKLPILAAGLGVLERNGVTNALINGGGDVLASGRLQGRPWRVGVRDPRAPDKLLGAIAIEEGLGIVASSGDYERGFVHQGRRLHHVLDPQTGWPTQGVHGVALLARDVQAVNGWGTALMVQGMAAVPAWSAARPGVGVLAAGSDGALWQSKGMQAALKPVTT